MSPSKKTTTAKKPPAVKPAKKGPAKPATTPKPDAAPTSPPVAEAVPQARQAPVGAAAATEAVVAATPPVEQLKPAKTPKVAKPAPAPKPKRMSGLDAAHLVLKNATAPMRTIDMLAVIQAKGLWKSHGKTPEATIYAAIIREISAQGEASRFVKAGKGLFSAAT